MLLPPKSGSTKLSIAVFVLSSIGATFVNKYVLSVLKFTYPTVYQSWQMGVAFSFLVTASSLGLIQLSSFDRYSLKQWLPAMCLFTLGIYSGSKALSKLPVPIFFTMFHLVYIFSALADELLFKKNHPSKALFGLVIGSAGLVFSIRNDNQFDIIAYKWMLIHCFSSASYSCFAKNIYKSQLRDLDKIIYNSSFSFITLMAIGTISGEVGKALEFPFLYYKKFHAGCIASGICGALLGLSYSRLTELIPVAKLRWISSISMAMTSALSLVFFEFVLSTTLALSIIVALSGSIIYTYSVAQVEVTRDPTNIEDSKTNNSIL